MVRKKSSPHRKNEGHVAKGDTRVKVTFTGVEDCSDTVLVAVMNGSTDDGFYHNTRTKTVTDDDVSPLDPNEMLRNENVQLENNNGNRHLLGCVDMGAFESKLKTHFITYFERQDVGNRLCGLHSLNNAANKRVFKEGMLRKIQEEAHNRVNDLVTDGTEVDEFEDDALGNFSIEVLCLAVQRSWGTNLLRYTANNTNFPSRFIICQKGDECNHFFALHGVPGGKWLLKDSLYVVPYMISTFVTKTLLRKWVEDTDNYTVHYFDDPRLEDISNIIDYNYMIQRQNKRHILNYVWVDKTSIRDQKVSITHMPVSTTLEDGIPDGHNCRYIDQQHLNVEYDDMAYPEFSDDSEHIANLSDSDDSLIEDKLEDTDHFNRQTFSSVVTMLNYILCPYSECTFEKLKSCKGTSSHKMITTYNWTKENLDTKFGAKQEGLARQISVRKFDGYLRSIVGENNVVFEKLSSDDWKQMHWIDKDGQRPTYYIVHGVFERYPSSSRPSDSTINYLASPPGKRNKKYDYLFQGQVLVDSTVGAIICHFQRHSIHGGIVPRPFELYLPMDETGMFLTPQVQRGWKVKMPDPYMREVLAVFKVEITCKKQDMTCFGKK